MGEVSQELQCYESGIEGALLQDLNCIETPGGAVLHMLRQEYPLMPTFPKGFGELYFSEVLPGAVKAWKRHKCQTQLFAVPYGRLKIVLFDDRPTSATYGTVKEIQLGRPDHYRLLRIPQMVWYGFTAVGNAPALICNCADLPHDPTEGERRPPNDAGIPYVWE